MPKIILPPREKIIKTSDEDSGPERYYSPNTFIRKIYLDRLQISLDLLGNNKYNKLLEIGYGNGMLFPFYQNFAEELYGIDIHCKEKIISNLFPGNFLNGSIYDIPLPDNSFDCIICLSVFEHLENLEKAVQEIKRVATKNADIIIGFPSDNIFIKTFFWLKKSTALKYHINSKDKLIKFLSANFTIAEKNTLNIFGINCYSSFKCKK